jgi:hypothetical protein
MSPDVLRVASHAVAAQPRRHSRQQPLPHAACRRSHVTPRSVSRIVDAVVIAARAARSHARLQPPGPPAAATGTRYARPAAPLCATALPQNVTDALFQRQAIAISAEKALMT